MNSIEKEKVFDSYSNISNDFDITRIRVWPCVRNFMDSLESYSQVLEIGCGNGKNLLYRKDLNSIGTDFVPNMVSICSSKGISCLQANALQLPFLDNTFDHVISIAVFHHLSTEERRIQAFKEMIRVMKSGGRGLLVVWAYEQQYNNEKTAIKHPIDKGDNLIRWHGNGNTSDVSKAHRYYYFYDKESFTKYIDIDLIIHNKVFWESGNWILDFTKK